MPENSEGVRFAYLDESGDLAFKRLGAGSGTTDYFIVGMILMDDPVPLYSAIDRLKDRLGMPRRMEFKFSATSRPRRKAFLEELRRHDLTIRAVAINKELISGRPETASERLLYREILRRTVVHHRDGLCETSLTLDQYIRGRKAQRDFDAMLRRSVNTPDLRRLADVRHVDSRANNLIQAADMVAGAIYRSRAHNDHEYVEIIQSRIHEIWEWTGDDAT